MDNRSRDVRESILERVFPDLRYGGDPDIERYFELRSANRMFDAISIYKGRLRPRYPDDAKRIVLLKLYRTRSPAFADFLHGLLMERADEIVVSIQRTIDALVAPLVGVPMKNPYAVLKAIESVARLLPDDTDAARHFAWTYIDYSKLLSYRKAEVERVSFLLGEFYDQASIEDELPTDFIATSLASEEARRQRDDESEKKNFFDLSKIEFDAADVRRIEIPSGFSRDEDVVLAYCHKYWLRVDDPAFERIVWLYSKKYGTKHHEVFRSIKTGRNRKYPDDDVLTMVATTIATRYNYTVQGDLYMQATWRRLKANLYGQQSPAAVTAPAAPPLPRTVTAPRKKAVRAADKPTRASTSAAKRSRGSALLASNTAVTLRSRPKTAVISRLAPLRRESSAPIPAMKATGSISDKIKRLSGRAYDVYKDIFLSRVRSHIRVALLASRKKPGGVFHDETNRAENLVFEFIEGNYANAYMDWQSSEQRSGAKDLGFELDSLDGIIEACYRKIDA